MRTSVYPACSGASGSATGHSGLTRVAMFLCVVRGTFHGQLWDICRTEAVQGDISFVSWNLGLNQWNNWRGWTFRLNNRYYEKSLLIKIKQQKKVDLFRQLIINVMRRCRRNLSAPRCVVWWWVIPHRMTSVFFPKHLGKAFMKKAQHMRHPSNSSVSEISSTVYRCPLTVNEKNCFLLENRWAQWYVHVRAHSPQPREWLISFPRCYTLHNQFAQSNVLPMRYLLSSTLPIILNLRF